MLHKVEPSELNSVMEFDTVIYSAGNGYVETVTAIWSPELYFYLDPSEPNGMYRQELTEPWELMNGYSGQYGYSGPVMHPSEFIGGKMATDILEQEGYYVAVTASYERPDAEPDIDGWAVARVLPDNLLVKVLNRSTGDTREEFLSEFWDDIFPVMVTHYARERIHTATGELLRRGATAFGWWTLELVQP